MIVPSLDLLGGRVVQLRGGDPDDCRVALDDVHGVAAALHRYGELAVIDLDAALGRGDNLELIASLCARFQCRVGGGIRDHARADRLLRAGARQLIIGTRATPEFLDRYPRERLLVALDARGREVVDHGWTRGTGAGVLDRARALAPHCAGFLYTQVDREGSLGGIDLEAVRALVEATDRHVVAAGGIASVAEIVALDRMGASCQLGMGIYTGAIDLAEAFLALLDWTKHGGLLPMIAQDEAGQVVMHAWVDRPALAKTLVSGEAWYFSRARQALWRKGETSGHVQRVDAVRYDCDRDTLLARVRQTGRACHLPERYGCFGAQEFGLERLEAALQGRVAALAAADGAVGAEAAGSFTARLLREPGLIESKLIEEAGELAEAEGPRAIAWEAADVLFFVLAKLVREGVPLAAALRELEGRVGRRRGADGAMVRADTGAEEAGR
jgi:phosphoribosyl-ATP pyrophosphohydrolase